MSRIAKTLILTLLLISLSIPQASAKTERQNIYVIDCTRSMERDFHIWDAAKSTLDRTLSLQDDGETEIVVIPFGDKAHEPLRFKGSEYAENKEAIFKAMNKLMEKSSYTNILDALNCAIATDDPSCKSSIYLMTDGTPSSSKESGDVLKRRLKERIDQWCGEHNPGSRLLYVVLSEAAKDRELMSAVDICNDAVTVDCSTGSIPILTDIAETVYASIRELDKSYPMEFSLSGVHKLVATSRDPFFDAEVVGGESRDHRLSLRFIPRDNHTIESLHAALADVVDGDGNYEFMITITSGEPDVRVANPRVSVIMSDHLPTMLTLGEGEERQKMPEAKWHDRFLWSDAAPDSTSEIDLNPIFTNAIPETVLNAAIVAGTGNRLEPADFTLCINGNTVKPGERFSIRPGDPMVVKVTYSHDAKTGKRFFTLVDRGSTGLDLINGAAYSENIILQSKYSRSMNPLALTCLIIAIAIIVALLLWFCALKHYFFPRIKTGRLVGTGPEGFYLGKKIKGKRKVVLCTKKRRQSLINKLFTGAILYIPDPVFDVAITITPATKKRIHFSSDTTDTGHWFFSQSTIGLGEHAMATKERTKIQFDLN